MGERGSELVNRVRRVEEGSQPTRHSCPMPDEGKPPHRANGLERKLEASRCRPAYSYYTVQERADTLRPPDVTVDRIRVYDRPPTASRWGEMRHPRPAPAPSARRGATVSPLPDHAAVQNACRTENSPYTGTIDASSRIGTKPERFALHPCGLYCTGTIIMTETDDLWFPLKSARPPSYERLQYGFPAPVPPHDGLEPEQS
jgi:hypothetical protein